MWNPCPRYGNVVSEDRGQACTCHWDRNLVFWPLLPHVLKIIVKTYQNNSTQIISERQTVIDNMYSIGKKFVIEPKYNL